MKTSTLQLPKTIYACKKSKFPDFLWHLIFIAFAVIWIFQILFLLKVLPYDGKTLPLVLNTISYSMLLVMMLSYRYINCHKHFVQFDQDKLIFKTLKNKKTIIPYKDIDSHEIHIFEIVFYLKNGKKEVLNLDNFVYENIRKIKETLLKVLG